MITGIFLRDALETVQVDKEHCVWSGIFPLTIWSTRLFIMFLFLMPVSESMELMISSFFRSRWFAISEARKYVVSSHLGRHGLC